MDRALWIGAATDDSTVAFSRTTGQVTQHIGLDVDHGLADCLANDGQLNESMDRRMGLTLPSLGAR